jgi:signal transduction histidine kinase
VREAVNDEILDRHAWVFDGDRVVERPTGVPRALDREAVALGRARRRAEREGPGDVRLQATPVSAAAGGPAVGAVVVSLAAEPLERLQQQVLLGSIVISLLVLLAGGLTTRSAVSGALRPVAQMTEAAQSWGAHDLDRRFDLGAPRDELTALAATLDELLARIAASRRHEQHFAGEVAHELRTPLAALRGRAELALSAEGDSERVTALGTIISQADRLDGAIDALLAVARQELDPSVGVIDLSALAREIPDAHVEAPAGLPAAQGDMETARRALAPLVDNARRHGGGRVVLRLDAGGGSVRLAVLDDGPGLDPALGDRAFDPGVRGAHEPDGGAGLGLALARRLARSCGGDVTAGPGPGGHFVLALPAIGFSR